ncbi:hypothetical protein [Streptacidiphilus rugosus]|uniref:hypothetical protein n=1 Tax=Streptacidiphilus rugosus TaxID=405783 RepID=UPI0005672259|nr:hypothetical protein [Streptacidiphilus rugosus]
MEVQGKLFDWLLELLLQNAGVDTGVMLVAMIALLCPREQRRSPVGVILALGLVMFFGGHLVLRITVPGSST